MSNLAETRERGNNKKKKVIISLIIAALFLAVLYLLWPFDGRPPSGLVVYNAEASAGGEVFVSVGIHEYDGIAGFVIDLDYDRSKLQPLEISRGNVIPEGLFISNFDPKVNSGSIRATWIDTADVTEEGELYWIRFRVLSREKGDIPITLSYSSGNIANQNLERVELKVSSGKVTVN